uniref:Transposase Tc1-like domain-containing protein n=1 Tax=Salarias fasciatus TaxID=181472 RepID=A0A672JAI7_SALFA
SPRREASLDGRVIFNLCNYLYISERYRSVRTVSFTIKRNSESGANFDRKRSGRSEATTESEDKFLRVNSLRDRRLTGQQLQAQLNTAGLTAARKPLLRRQNKTKRLAWAKKHCHWPTEDWEKVLWSEESKFEILSSSLKLDTRWIMLGIGRLSFNGGQWQGLALDVGLLRAMIG